VHAHPTNKWSVPMTYLDLQNGIVAMIKGSEEKDKVLDILDSGIIE